MDSIVQRIQPYVFAMVSLAVAAPLFVRSRDASNKSLCKAGDEYLDVIPPAGIQGVGSTKRAITCDDSITANSTLVCGPNKWTAFSGLLELFTFMLIISAAVIVVNFILKNGISLGGTALVKTLLASNVIPIIVLALFIVLYGLLVDMVVSALDNKFIAITKTTPTIMVMGPFVPSLLVGEVTKFGKTGKNPPPRRSRPQQRV